MTVAAFAAALLISTPANAEQPPCTKRGNVVDHLGKKYSEAPVAMGLANNGGVLEVLSSPDGTSWTIMITMPNGISCLVAAGENWEAIPIKVGEAM